MSADSKRRSLRREFTEITALATPAPQVAGCGSGSFRAGIKRNLVHHRRNRRARPRCALLQHPHYPQCSNTVICDISQKDQTGALHLL